MTERFEAPHQLTQADLGMETRWQQGNSLQERMSVPLLGLKADSSSGLNGTGSCAAPSGLAFFKKGLFDFRVTGATRAVGTAANPASSHPH